ncbi:MAG TPA: Fe2+-dependent dioxygenase [Sphingomonas sp.]|jgi:PKHD-type hydroxylase
MQAQVFGREEAAALREALADAPFRDGRATAGAAAERVKRNEQARGDDARVIAAARRVRLALEAHPLVRGWARPVRWSTPMFARYGPGQGYGLHADAAAMHDQQGWPIRTDISFTLFLSEPDTYDGGALLIREGDEEREFRPGAGSAVLYPTGRLHAVAPVTRGERLVCVGWMQSLIRGADRRELLFDLERVRRGGDGDDAALLLDRAIGDLLRMWGEH